MDQSPDAPKRVRCNRCRKTTTELVSAVKHFSTHSRIVQVCVTCSQSPTAPCRVCADLPWRVAGKTCTNCGLRFSPESLPQQPWRGAFPIEVSPERLGHTPNPAPVKRRRRAR